MLEKFQEQQGFTLIESLVVLNLVWILLLIPVIPFNQMKSSMEASLFFEEIQSDITLMQNHAILNSEWTEVEIRPQAREMTFRVMGDRENTLNHSVTIPDSIEIMGGIKTYRFLSNSGNQGNLTKTRFKVSDEIYVLSFSLGSGRFEISKDE